MAFDLDNEELKATRRDKGLDDVLYEETSDKNVGSIEDIRDLLLFLKSHGWIPDINRTVNITNVLLAIDNVLQEREQDKKRIQELEEERKKYIVQLTDEQYRNLVDTIRREVRQELEQKVKDKIKEIKEDKESKYFDTFLMARDINYAIKILEELLGDK